MPSPFPGMDPYLEDPGLWPDVHNSLIVEARASLVRQLRPKYAVRIEERVYVSGGDDPGRDAIIPDIRIAGAARRKGAGLRPRRGGLSVAEPEVLTTLLDDEIHEPYLKVIDSASGQAVTVIEVLSPTNKIPGAEGRRGYQQKKAEVLDSPTHWMEIDLLRAGAPVVPRLARPYDYVVHVSRADQRPKGYVWRIFLDQRLPVVGVPLLPEDAEAPLDLQEVLNSVYDRAGYDLSINYRRPPAVRLTREQARWANELLRSKGLR